MTEQMTPEQRRARSIEARQFTQHTLYREMFEGVSQYLENRAITCDPKDKDMAADVIRCKQLLLALRREIERRVEDGDFAAFEIEQLEKKSLVRMFRR